MDVRVEPAQEFMNKLSKDWEARCRLVLADNDRQIRVEVIMTGLNRVQQVSEVSRLALRLKALLKAPTGVLEAALQLIAAEDELATSQSKVTQARERLRTVSTEAKKI